MRIPLNAKDRKQLFSVLQKQYENVPELAYHFFLNERDATVWIISQTIGEVPLDDFRINNIGLYFGEYNDDQTQIRLSIEGSQLIGPTAKKNVLLLPDELIRQWVAGQSIDVAPDIEDQTNTIDSYALVRNDRGDFFGSCRIKNAKVLNFLPKARRVQELIDVGSTIDDD